MPAVAPPPPLLALVLGAVGAGASPFLPAPLGALALGLGAGLCLAGAMDLKRPVGYGGVDLLRLLGGLFLILLPFWPALGLTASLLVAAQDPRALLWLTVLYALLLAWTSSLAPWMLGTGATAPQSLAAHILALPRIRFGDGMEGALRLTFGLSLFVLGFLWAALVEGLLPASGRYAFLLAGGVSIGAWLFARAAAASGAVSYAEAPASEPRSGSPAAAEAAGDRELTLERRLYDAARQGRVEEALILLDAGAAANVLPEPQDADQRSLMQIAVTLPDLRLLRALIERGVAVNEEHGGITPLIAATRDSRSGRLEAVLTLLANGARLDGVDRERNQAVHHAARCENPAVIAALLDAGASLDPLNGDGMTPLGLALEAQCWATAEYLIRRGAALDPPGGCPAMVAAARGVRDDPTGIRLLLKAKARVEASDRLGRRALHHAALHGHGRMVEALLSAGADPNAQDAHGATPVMEAVRAGEPRVLERLAFAKPDLSRRDVLGRTALFIAVSGKHPDPMVCKVLLAMGADPREPGPEGLSPLDQARALGRWSLVRLLDPAAPLPASLDAEGAAEGEEEGEAIDPLALLLAALEAGREAVAERLLALPLAHAELAEIAVRLRSLRGFRWLCARSGLHAEVVLADGRSLVEALHGLRPVPWRKLAVLPGAAAALAGKGVLAAMIEALEPGAADGEALLLALIEAGADIFGCGPSGQAPLHAAVAVGSLPLAAALLDRGVDPNALDPFGRTPLARAVIEHRDAAWLRLLLRHGADPQRRDASGETALGLAFENGDRDAVAWLHTPAWVWPGRPLRDADLIAAARLGDVESLERLARLGLPADACDQQGASALLHAAGLGRASAVAWLLARGADPNRIAANGASPLSAAIVGRSLGVLRQLLEAGADPERELAGGASALFVAAALGEADAARLLIGFGARVDRCEEKGRTPLMVAAEALFRASIGGEDGEGLASTIAVLLEAGAKAARRSERGDTALGMLLGSRVQPGKPVSETILLSSLHRLLAAGADPDAQDDRGVGPLHAAAIHGLLRCTLLLLERGADPTRPDRLGRRPVDLARLLGYAALVGLYERNRGQRPQDSSRRTQDEGLS